MTKRRIDWTPGPAAAEALDIGQMLLPHLGRQALIDRLVITGLAALKRPPLPALQGRGLEAWRLPADLRLQTTIPGNAGLSP